MGCGSSVPAETRYEPSKRTAHATSASQPVGPIVTSVPAAVAHKSRQGVPGAPTKATPRQSDPHAPSVLGKGIQDLEKTYELVRVLGRGQFGTTWLVIHRGSNEYLACKSIAKSKLTCEEDVEDIRREVQIMHHLKGHPNITYLQEVVEDAIAVHLIMGLCSGGELFDRITERGHFSEADAAAYMRTIVSVVAHCHSLGVLHRDLKPENFLLDKPGDAALLKCTDFGLSTFFKPGEIFKDVVGSAYYVAPEVLHHRYGPEADIWSCGVILYILLSGMPPFWGDTEKEVFDKVLKGDLDFSTHPWPMISQEAKDCVSRMLVQSPRRRILASELLVHPWMRENGVASDKPLDDAIITRLGTFATHNKLKREAMRVIAAGMPAEEIAGLQSIFEAIDKDKSGTITAEELRLALEQKGAILQTKDLQILVSLIDGDANGTIDYEEFIAATLSQHQILTEEHMVRAFRHFDADNSGSISPEELKRALASANGMTVSDAEIKAILDEVDKDKSGTIDYKEFCEMMAKNKASALRVASVANKKRGSLNPYKASKTVG